MSKIYKYLAIDKKVRIAVINSTQVVNEICVKQGTMPLASILLGRAVTGAILMASQMKDGQALSLHFKGDGPIESIYAEASYEGIVRGYVSQPSANIEADEDGIVCVGKGIGKGVLSVVKNSAEFEQPATGTVEIQTGEIGDDIAFYLEQSDQTNSVVAVGTHLDNGGKIKHAGGIIIEIMQDISEDELLQLEDAISKASSLNQMFEKCMSEKEVAENFLGGFQLEEMSHPNSYRYQCRCSKETMINSIRLIDRSELEDMFASKDDIEVTCEMCKEQYILSKIDLADS